MFGGAKVSYSDIKSPDLFLKALVGPPIYELHDRPTSEVINILDCYLNTGLKRTKWSFEIIKGKA